MIMSSCTREPMRSPQAGEKQPILWDVRDVKGMEETRALIDNNDELIQACKPAADGGDGKSIGVWADYTILEGAGEPDASGASSNGRLVTYKNVFDNAEIIYKEKVGGNFHSDWNVSGGDVYWAIGGDYKFRAYYPQTMTEYITSNSDADIFIVEYKSELVQEDLCVAYNAISTSAQGWNSSDVVFLDFDHCMSALRFKFVMGYDNSDKITSCWLENTSSKTTQAFSTLGLLIYGAQEEGDDDAMIDWTEGYWPEKGTPFYKWSSSAGIYFDGDTEAIAYTDKTSAVLGKGYVDNDGWILIIPQKSRGHLDLCFTTEKGGDKVYRVRIPEATEYDASSTPLSSEYIRARRYTYTVEVSETDLTMSVSSADWNERRSSVEIIL